MWKSGEVRQYVAGFTACFSMVVSGSCFGWVTPILDHLQGPDSEIRITVSQSSWMVAIIELGNVVSPIPASFLADRWGRKPSILLTGPLYFLSWLMVLFYPCIEVLYMARIIQGLSMGIVFTVVPLYLSEISSPGIRGSISSLFHNSWYLGHLIEYCLGPCLSYRNYTYATACLPIIFMIIFHGQPESPYFLLMRKKDIEAAFSLARLRGCAQVSSVDEELQTMAQSVTEEMQNKASWTDIVRTAADRRSLYIVIGLGTIRVLNGIIAVMTYSTQTFGKIYSSNSTVNDSAFSIVVTPNNTTILLGTTLFVSSFFASVIADMSGRRQLLMFSCLGAGVNMFLAGGYFFLDEKLDINVSRYNWFPLVVIIAYSLFITLGIGPVSVMLQSEMFLSNTRGFASSISAINLTINAFFILKFYQVIADGIGVFLIFWLFCLVCFVGSFWVYFTVPETKGKTFSQIRQELRASLKQNSSPRKSHVVPVIEISDASI